MKRLPNEKIRIAFIKFGGLATGGTERWLQMMAANLPRDQFDVDYYYCDAAPYIGSDYKHEDTDPDRLRYMREHEVNLIKFNVGAKDITKPDHVWVDTDFWQVFDAEKYDLVQTGKAGPAEYPYYLLNVPVVEFVSLLAGVDRSPNIAWSIHLSQWQRAEWARAGGSFQKSSVIPIPAEPPASVQNLREMLGISTDAVVAGFHQRVDDAIFSPIPLQAFARFQQPHWHFIIMGGGHAYRKQAEQLGLHNVHFVEHSGKAEDISRFLNTLDLFAHGRRDGETFGTVLAEAMMHGLPCLSHNSPDGANAQPETIGPAGVFASDQNDYAAKLKILLSDSDLRGKLASKARPHAEAYYSLSSCVEELGDVYRRLCGQVTTSQALKRIPYAYSSRFGFLCAGDLESPSSPARHVCFGNPEEFEVHIVRFFLPHVRTFIDIGANTGLYCFVAAQESPAGAQIHAFVPQPDCCDAMRKTVFLNNWEDRLSIHPIGIGSLSSEFTLHLSGTGSSFDNSFNDDAKLPTISVAVDTLDNQRVQLGWNRVDFVKIDVEGFQQQVLKGAVQTIETDQPVLFIEHAYSVRDRKYCNPSYAQTLSWLAERGYRIWRCTEDNKLIAADPNQPPEHLAMYLCLHEDAHAQWMREVLVWANEYRRHKKRENVVRKIDRLGRALSSPQYAVRVVMSRIKRGWLRTFGKA